jgi:hypothetical protein
MAGRVVVSTLNNDTGVLATQNGMTGIAKAWVNFNGSGTIAGSFNVSSVTVRATGNFTVNFTTAMPNANYAVSGICTDDNVANRGFNIQGTAATTMTTTSCFVTVFPSGSPSAVTAIFHSS